jgi:hypothetical protein
VPSRHAPEAQVKPLTTPLTTKEAGAPLPSLSPARPLQSAPPPKTAHRPEIADDPLPLAYGDDRITLLCKDPHWLHAYWEITEPTQRRTLESLGEQRVTPILRLHHYPSAAAADSDRFDDIGVSDWRMGHEYVQCGRPDAAFEIEIGFKAEDGRFAALARSRRVSTPRDCMSDEIDDEWPLVHGDQALARASARSRHEMSSLGVSNFGHARPSRRG